MTTPRDHTGYVYRALTGPCAGGTITVVGAVPGGWLCRRDDGHEWTQSTRTIDRIRGTRDRQLAYVPGPTAEWVARLDALADARVAGHRRRRK